MLVVKQGGGAVVNLNRMEIIFIKKCDDEPDGGCYILAMGASGKRLVLGRYKDEKHANDVLKEMLDKQEEEIRERAYKMPEAWRSI